MHSVHSWSYASGGFFPVVLLGTRIFPTAGALGSTGVLSGQGPWGCGSTNVMIQGASKPHPGAFWAFRDTASLHRSQVYSAVPQFGIYNPAFPERQLWFRFVVLKTPLCLRFLIKASDINGYPASLQRGFPVWPDEE